MAVPPSPCTPIHPANDPATGPLNLFAVPPHSLPLPCPPFPTQSSLKKEGEEPVAVEEVVDLLVTASSPEPSSSIFQCLNDSSIIFDGRVVVDAAFRTNDPNIYAAGTIAKLSRRFGQNVLFQHHNRWVSVWVGVGCA